MGGLGGQQLKGYLREKSQMNIFQHLFSSDCTFLALSVSLLLLAEPYFKDLTSSGVFFWLLLALIVSVYSGISGIGIYGTGKVGLYQISGFVDALIRTLFQIIAVFIGFGVAGLTGGFVGGVIAGGMMNFRYLDLKIVKFRLSHLTNLSGFSFWIFLTASGSLVFSYADTILIGFFMSNADVGIYRTAFQSTSISTFSTMAFHTVLYPKISNWGTLGKITDIENSLARAWTYSLILAIPICIGGWILGYNLLYYFYGSSFVGGAPALFFLLLVQIMNVFAFLGSMSLTALNRPKDAFQVTVIASIANILLDVILIPVLGITGAAIATLIAITFNAVGILYLLSRIIAVKFESKSIKNIMYASGFMGICLVSIHFLLPLTHVGEVVTVVILGAAIYILVLFKLDRGIHDEIQDLCVNIGVPWPQWL